MFKTYFCVSDLHSNYTALKTALDSAKFDINNKSHILVILGDLFDRCEETLELYTFIKSLPKSRCILIRGNHEDLYMQLLAADMPRSHDFSNGTVKTFCHIAGVSYSSTVLGLMDNIDTWSIVKSRVAKSPVTRFLKSSRWINYLEIGPYILTHAFIPTSPTRFEYYNLADGDEFINWREKATEKQWNDARWKCPYQMILKGCFGNEITHGKTLVCGHWHAADFHAKLKHDPDNYGIYESEAVIAIDTCTAYTNKVNVLKIIETADDYILDYDETPIRMKKEVTDD